MPFQFRQFSLADRKSSMLTGTDAILLGAWTQPGEAMAVLDAGTGCGIIALMLAQKSNALIDAVDIHEDSIVEAGNNFRNSPWKERLLAIHSRIQDLRNKQYDLICTNPPFFRNSMKPPRGKRSDARHDDGLTYEELVACAERILSPEGRLTVILPAGEKMRFTGIAIRHLLFLHKAAEVVPVEGNPPNRIMMEFGRTNPPVTILETIVIRNKDNSWANRYKELTRDYYISLR